MDRFNDYPTTSELTFDKLCRQVDYWKAEAAYWKSEHDKVSKDYGKLLADSIRSQQQALWQTVKFLINPHVKIQLPSTPEEKKLALEFMKGEE